MQNATTTKTKVIIKKCRRDQKKFSDFVYTVEEFWGSSHLLATVSWQSCSGLLQTAWQAQKGEEGGGGGEGKGKGAPSLTLSPQSPSPFPFLPIPYPFRRLLRRLPLCTQISAKTLCSHQWLASTVLWHCACSSSVNAAALVLNIHFKYIVKTKGNRMLEDLAFGMFFTSLCRTITASSRWNFAVSYLT